jgi:hypothetical protein
MDEADKTEIRQHLVGGGAAVGALGTTPDLLERTTDPGAHVAVTPERMPA